MFWKEKVFSCASVEDTYQFAKEVISKCDQNVIALFGDLGSGKTTFTQGVGKALGISQRITSPTFILMRRYEITDNQKWDFLFHVDLYRTNSFHDIEGLGLLDLMKDPKNLFVIEWADKMKEYLPEKRIEIEFFNRDSIQEGMREGTIEIYV